MSREFPPTAAGAFPAPPRELTDEEGRSIELREATDEDVESIVEMYVAFDPADRAQGIPPAREPGIRDWLDTIEGAGSLTVLANHDGDVVGHGMLVPDDEGAYELALFVLQAYQGAGIGTELLRTLLGLGREEGVERVWLSVERWNDAAIHVYEKVGFQRIGTASFEVEMAMALE